jgi:hypothetical protein
VYSYLLLISRPNTVNCLPLQEQVHVLVIVTLRVLHLSITRNCFTSLY